MDFEGADSSVSCFGSLMMVWCEHSKKYLVLIKCELFLSREWLIGFFNGLL
jgi:hypothetical protein